DAFWKAIDAYELAGDASATATALDLFATDHAADPIAPDALLRLARTYEATSQPEKAISAYNRLRGAYPKSLAAAKGTLALAILLEKAPQTVASAQRVLGEFVDDTEAAGRSEDDYRAALFELAALCYRAGDVRNATPRLEKFLGRFTSNGRAPEAM